MCRSALRLGGRRPTFWRDVRRPNGYDRHAQHPAVERSSACCSAAADGLPRLILFMRPDRRLGGYLRPWPINTSGTPGSAVREMASDFVIVP